VESVRGWGTSGRVVVHLVELVRGHQQAFPLVKCLGQFIWYSAMDHLTNFYYMEGEKG